MASKRAASYIGFYWKPHRNILVVPEDMDFRTYCKKWYFLRLDYPKLGLYHDDVVYDRWPHTQEAVRRLPSYMKEERDWRALRAIQLDLNHEILPEDQWTKFADDQTKGRYLQPYIEEVLAEFKEKDTWNSIY